MSLETLKTKVGLLIEKAQSGGGGTEEIENIIDKSGVLGTTDETVTVTEKVEQLIDKAEDENIWYEVSEKLNQTTSNMFSNCTFETLPRMNPKNVPKTIYWFSGNTYLKYVDFYLNTESCTDFGRMFLGASSLEYVVGINTSKATTVQAMFARCSSLHTIGEMVDGKWINPLDFSNVATTTQCFDGCIALVNVFFEEKSIKKSITIPSPVLSDESKDSIINGLAYVTTAQTLTVSKNAGFTAEHKATAQSKGWTVVEQ